MTVVIESGFIGAEYDLNHPRIGYERVAGALTTNVPSEDGFNAQNAETPLTYTAWQPTSVPAVWRLTFVGGGTETISYLGIGVHNIGSSGATVTLQSFDGATWANWGGGMSVSPDNDDAIMFLVEPAAVNGIGILIEGAVARVGTISAGDVLEWPRKATWTGLPITESETNRYNVNQSDTGNWLGRTRIASGLEFDMTIDNLSETFRRGEFETFRNHANTGDGTFFVAPRPLDYPDEVAYAWSPETIRMERNVPKKEIAGSVSMSLRGYKAP